MKIVTTLSVLALLLGAGVAHAAKTTTAAATTAPASSSGSTTHMAAGQFSTETAAKDSCGSSPVVWVNKSSKVIHPSGDKYFGKTKSGAYMCQSTAQQAGYHMPGPSKATKPTAKKS
jgi:hypothetical protein